MTMNKFPWVPILTIERSGLPEITVSGIISVVTGSGSNKQVIAQGDVNCQLWSRSLLKPWQLLSFLPVLKEQYPKLAPQHFAIMTASHRGEPEHLCVLRDLLKAGRLTEDALKCPETLPLDSNLHHKFRQEGLPPSALFHNCSGKHLGYILSLLAKQAPIDNYLDVQGAHFEPLREVLAVLLSRSHLSFGVTTDGCRLPNYSLTPLEMATLYEGIARQSAHVANRNVSDYVREMLSLYPDIAGYMSSYPRLIGGTDSIDSKIMLGKMFDFPSDTRVIAKWGADGLLAIGVGPCQSQPDGLGILVKLASGFVMRYMELIVGYLLGQLGVIEKQEFNVDDPGMPHLKTKFHFCVTP